MAFLGEECHQVVDRRWSEHFAGLERQLERRGAKVRQEHVQVVGIEARLLRPRAEQELRVVDDVLVDRGAGRDHDADAGPRPPTGTTELLPGAGDGTRVARQDGDVEAPDIHAELQRVGADDPEDLAVAQALLDGAPLGWQVPAAVAPHPAARPVALAQRLAQARQDDLDRGPRATEHDRLAAGPDEGERPALCKREGRTARPGRRVEQGRVDEQDVAHAGRRPVPVDEIASRGR